MSKSLGNFANLLDLIDQVDPRAYRMVLLQAHYRSPVEVGQERLDEAARVGRPPRRAWPAARRPWPDAEPDAAVLDAFRARMDDDLDTPGAMAVVFDAVTRANAAARRRRPRPRPPPWPPPSWRRAGPSGWSCGPTTRCPTTSPPRPRALDAARAAKDYAAADAIRAALQAEGWVVETHAGGTTVRRP